VQAPGLGDPARAHRRHAKAPPRGGGQFDGGFDVIADVGMALGEDRQLRSGGPALGVRAGALRERVHPLLGETQGVLGRGLVLGQADQAAGGDEIRPLVVVSALHMGTRAIRAMTTPVRAVCANTVRARPRARAGCASRAPRRRTHRPAARGAPLLGLTVDYYRQFARLGDELALGPIGERRLHDILGQLHRRHCAQRPDPRARARA
jgi:hypothetical protein